MSWSAGSSTMPLPRRNRARPRARRRRAPAPPARHRAPWRARRSGSGALRRVAGQRDPHPQHDRVGTALEHARAVGQPEVGGRDAAHRPRLSRRSTSTSASAISTPYAPTFCTGTAPVRPGMPERHSSPPRPSATVAATTSSHSSPASTVSSTDPSGRRSTRRPRVEIRTTVPGHPSSAITRFDPPPDHQTRARAGLRPPRPRFPRRQAVGPGRRGAGWSAARAGRPDPVVPR